MKINTLTILSFMSLFLGSCSFNTANRHNGKTAQIPGGAESIADSEKREQSEKLRQGLALAPEITVNHLPYKALMSKLKSVTELPDKSYEVLRQSRLTLGGYDHASGVVALLSWNTQKKLAWLRGVTPVCKAASLAKNYDDMKKVEIFAEKAFGRPLTNAGKKGIREIFKAGGFAMTCLAVLSTVEFVSI